MFTKVLNLTRVALAVDVPQAAPPTAPVAPRSGITATTPTTSVLRKDLAGSILSGIDKTVKVPPIKIPPILVRKPDISLTPTRAGHITIEGGSSRATHTIVMKGDATLRSIFLDRGGRVVGDCYYTGAQSIATPANTADVFLLHQGTLPPLTTMRNLRLLVQNIGAESDTMAMAMGQRTFAAHGCVVRSHVPVPKTAAMFDTLAGAELMRSLTNFAITFPSLVRAATLILIVQATKEAPGPALDGIRWGRTERRLAA